MTGHLEPVQNSNFFPSEKRYFHGSILAIRIGYAVLFSLR